MKITCTGKLLGSESLGPVCLRSKKTLGAWENSTNLRTRVETFLDMTYLSLPLTVALWIVFWLLFTEMC